MLDQIIVVDSTELIEYALNALLNGDSIGMDTEWRPVMSKKGTNHLKKISLVVIVIISVYLYFIFFLYFKFYFLSPILDNKL